MSEPTSTPSTSSRPALSVRRRVPMIVRSVAGLDFFLGLWAVAVAAAYLFLYFENDRLTVEGRRVSETGVFFAIAVNVRWAADHLGLAGVPGGSDRDIPGSPTIRVFSPGRMKRLFIALATGYLVLAGAWLALSDGLYRGARWARRAQAVVGWSGLALIAVYGTLYLLSPDAPRVGLLAVAGSALVPAAMVLSARKPVEPPGDPPAAEARSRLGLPGWMTIALALATVALAVHLVLAWWGLLILKASM